MRSGYYRPRVGDIVQLTRGNTPALVIATYADRKSARILYGQSGHTRVDPYCSLHAWEGDLTQEQLDQFEQQIARLKDSAPSLHKQLMVCLRGYSEYVNQNPCEGKTLKGNDMKTLYTWIENEKEIYGHKLAVNSAGDWVMEKKDGGVISVSKDLVTEVMPYTVDATYFGSSSRYSFFARAGEFEEGDVVAHPEYTNLLRIAAVDTKSKKATVWMHGLKLTGTKIASGE